jgi:hypothetical protein
VLRVPPDWDAQAVGLALDLDGEDVTGRCALRTDRMWPPRRVELVLRAGDLAPGPHEAVVRWRGVDGAPLRHAWAFEAG